METNFFKPEPTYWTRDKIFKKAEEKALELEYLPGDDLFAIVEKLEGKIEIIEFDEWYSDTESGSIVIENDSFTIYLPNFTPPIRDRFTIAHELGHFFLHSNSGEKPIKVNRLGSGKLETEANYFAAAFLMPEALFKEYDEISNHDDRAMASRFLVSEAAIRVRRKTI